MPAVSRRLSWSTALVTLAALPAAGVAVSASDYSNYVPGNANASYQNPAVALGNLNPDTGGGEGGLTPFNPAWQPTDIAWVGAGGSLTLKLSSPVPTNGINLGVYSNVGIGDVSGNGTGQAGSPPGTLGQISRATVSVSQDGVNFVPLNSGQPISFANPTNWFTDTPITAGFQPTTGTAHASQSKPFLGSLSSLSGQTYSQILTTLNNSAGGTWLDLRNTGLATVNYVKFNVGTGDRMIVDAIGGLGAANAATLTNGSRVISEDVGTGTNTSDVVVDFGPQSYDFKVHYNTAINGIQALQLIQASSDLRVSTEHFSFGDFVNGIDYGGYADTGDGSTPPAFADYWAYYTGDGTSWTSSLVGAGDRLLSNGSYDGWVWNPAQSTAPDFAVAPEPASALALAAAAVIGLLPRRRRRRADVR